MQAIKTFLAVILGIVVFMYLFLGTWGSDGNAFDRLITFIQFFVVFAIPYLFIFDFWKIRPRLPLFRNNKPGHTVGGFIIFAVAWFVLTTFTLVAGDGLRSPEYLAAAEARQIAQAEAEAAAQAAAMDEAALQSALAETAGSPPEYDYAAPLAYESLLIAEYPITELPYYSLEYFAPR